MTPEKRDELLRTLESRFTSGNDVPVTRAMITREEYEQLRSLLADREGFVTVPVEPTKEMLEAACIYRDEAVKADKAFRHSEMYKAMLRASPTPEGK